jgi:hypothetical protein
MMIVGVLKRTGLFGCLAIWSVKRARAERGRAGRPAAEARVQRVPAEPSFQS